MLLIDNGFTAKMSGGDYHIIKVAQQWSKTNDVCFLVPKLGYDYVCNLLVGKVFVYNTPLENHAAGIIKTIILYIVRTWRALLFDAEGQFDVILASSHYPYDVIPALFLHLRKPRSKLVVYLHGISIPADTMLQSLVSTIYNILGLLLSVRFADSIFVINSSTREHLLHLGIKSEKAVITANGIEIGESADSKKEKIFDACFLGRLVKSKGVFDLLSIWKAVSKRRPNARLAILGDGPEKERMNKLATKTGLESNITLLGFVFGDEKYETLMSSDVFVFPSYLESWGISIAEAMAFGLPVVAYDLLVYKEVFEGKLVTVPLGDVDAMVRQVLFLLENPEDAKKMGEANREFVGRYDWSVVAQRELAQIMKLTKEDRSFRHLAREQR